jgi:hypothetical protein
MGHYLVAVSLNNCYELPVPTVSSRLKISIRSFYPTAPILWNNLPIELRLPALSSSTIDSLPFLLTPAQVHRNLKTHLL